MTTTFSILTPNFNQGRYLQRNIDSVRDQDVDSSSIEHIIIDGGSTDESVDVLKANDDALAYWVSEPDAGQAHALSKALDRATGDYVGWINADEYYDPNVFSTIQKAFEADADVVLVYGNVRRVDPAGNQIRINKQWRFDFDVCQVQTPIVINCGAFFKREHLIARGGFDPSWQYLMDWEMYIRLMRCEQKCKRLKQVVGNFTMHELSKTATAQPGFEAEIKRLHQREFPQWSEAEIEVHKNKQKRRMMRHMLMDGVLFEKAYFKLVKQRHYANYFGDPGARLPIISNLIDIVVPVTSPDELTTKPQQSKQVQQTKELHAAGAKS